MSTRVVGDSWVKTHVLGKGSYGTVYLATNPYSRFIPHIAVKSTIFSNSVSKFSLKKEEIILSILNGCPEVIQCYGHENTIECGYGIYNLLLEYAPGGSLSNLIKNEYGGKIHESHLQSYTRMMLKGLAYIHEKGFVHCDLKPDNILVFPSRFGISLKIADFGLSKKAGECQIYDQNSEDPRYRGTPLYASPESYFDGIHEAALDIWSLGCVIIEMFTGKLAWDTKNLDDLTNKMAFTYGPAIPAGLSANGTDFLKKCLRRSPKERWTAKMLLNHPFMVQDCRSSQSSFTFSRYKSGSLSSNWLKLMDDDAGQMADSYYTAWDRKQGLSTRVH